MHTRALLLLLTCLPVHAQTTWFVDDDACPAAGSGSQADPFCSVQSAIDAAAAGDTILVLPGTYAGALTFGGKDVHVRSVAGSAATTIMHRPFAFGPLLLFTSGEGPGAVLEGFTLRGGDPVVRCIGSSPTLRDNVITAGSAITGGAGLRITGGGSPLIIGNDIHHNTAFPGAGLGGGIYVQSASPRIENNVIHHNDAFSDGGSWGAGAAISNSTVTLIGNLFHDNRGTDQYGNTGGGLYGTGSTLLMIGNTFVNNAALDGSEPPPLGGPGFGGAIALRSSVVTLVNHVSWNNNATNGPELAMLSASGAVNVSFSLVEGGLGAVYQPAPVTWGEGNLDTDPMFVDPAKDDYHLLSSSPAVDKGWPGTAPGGTDGDGEPRILDGDESGAQRVDMGWDEVDAAELEVVGTPVPGGAVGFLTTGPAGQVYALAQSARPFDFTLAPYGSLLIDPTTLELIGLGVVPGADSIAVPPQAGLLGTRAYFQALVRAPSLVPGNFTRRVELTVQ